MPQSLSKVILHIIFTTKNREPWLDSANTAPHARLSGNDLPRFGERSIVRRRCDRSCAYRHDTAASALSVRPDRSDQKAIIEMDQSPWRSLSRLFLAARIWDFFGEPEPTRCCLGICEKTGRASSHPHLSGRIPRGIAQARIKFDEDEGRLSRAFSANTWFNLKPGGVAPGWC